MNWQNRLQNQITLTAPDGTQYTANWQANDISIEKMVGRFATPLNVGEIVQDLGAKGPGFPLILHFEGDDHDLVAWAFWNDFYKQKGNWTVIHPVYGSHTLQGINATLKADPTGSGNITVVETLWVEPITQDTSLSTADRIGQIAGQVNTVNGSCASQYQDAIDLTSVDEVSSAANTAGQVGAALQGSQLSKIVQTLASAQVQFTTLYNQAQATISSPLPDLQAFAGQVQQLVELPGTVTTDLGTIITAYAAFASSVIDSITGGTDQAGLANAATAELFLGACMAGACTAVIINTPGSRTEALQDMASLLSLWDDINGALDAVQSASAANDITFQYFSNSQAWKDLVALLGYALAYLLAVLYDLKMAKTFTLPKPYVPLDFVIQQYGAEYDQAGNSYLDLFIASNNLVGRDIVILPAGKQVTVYV